MLLLSSLYGNMKKKKDLKIVVVAKRKVFEGALWTGQSFFNSCKTDHLDI